MRLELALLGLGLALILPILAMALHKNHIKGIYTRLFELRKADFEISDIYDAYFRSQGPKFNAAAGASWSLFSICLGFLFFLNPEVSGKFSFISYSGVSSLIVGFWMYALVILIIILIILEFIPKQYRLLQMYSYYEISREWKDVIAYFVPILFLLSLLLSIHLGTIYPAKDQEMWTISFILLIVGEIALLLPVYSGLRGRHI